MNEFSTGTLYVVATPIGNLDDLSSRARHVLASVALIAAEDTRHSARMLRHLNIEARLISLHEHNEAERVEQLAARLEGGDDIALVSDAGTPLISDPGFLLVRALRERGLSVVPIPGPSALVTALCAAGLPTDRFTFAGFLPAKGGPRRARLKALGTREETLVFYESPHRIRDTLQDIDAMLGERSLVLARELTKTFETFLTGSAGELSARLEHDPDQGRGEFVVMLAGAPPRQGETTAIDGDTLLTVLEEEGVGVKQAAAVASRLLGGRKKQWYDRALSLRDDA